MAAHAEGTYDAILIGVGLASTAAARALADAGMRVALVEGAGRSRSLAADGGVIDPSLLARAFAVDAEHAPLDRVVAFRQRFRCETDTAVAMEPPERMQARWAFHRDRLEAWALHEAISRGAEYLDGFIEGTVIPGVDGALRLTSEDGQRQVSARVIALCEGADPRIPLRVGLRPDYGPEDQIHFAKTRIETACGSGDAAYRSGPWRTSWGMPVEVAVVPVTTGAVVWVAARIENVMRSSRSALNALDELLTSPAGRSLVSDGERGATGVELVAKRPSLRPARLSAENLLVGVDASGMLDPRDIARPDQALRAGELLATHVRARLHGGATTHSERSWDDAAMGLIRDLIPAPAGYHDSRTTGFLEEATGAERLKEPVRRLREGLLTRLCGGR